MDQIKFHIMRISKMTHPSHINTTMTITNPNLRMKGTKIRNKMISDNSTKRTRTLTGPNFSPQNKPPPTNHKRQNKALNNSNYKVKLKTTTLDLPISGCIFPHKIRRGPQNKA